MWCIHKPTYYIQMEGTRKKMRKKDIDKEKYFMINEDEKSNERDSY